MVSVTDVRAGNAIEIDGELFICLRYEHTKPGKGPAFVKLLLKSIRTGAQFEKRFNTGDKVKKAFLVSRPAQFLYADHLYHFMDGESFEMIDLDKEMLGDNVDFLVENMTLTIVTYEGKPISIELPNAIETEVVETDPGLKGDSASSGTKPATIATGTIIQVPLFINIGDKIRIDTRKREYITRVSS